MRTVRVIALIALLVTVLVPETRAAKEPRGPSTAEERAEVVRLTKYLEANPLADDAEKWRKILFAWLVDVPDISVKACSEFMEPLIGAEKNHGGDLYSR